MTRFLTLTEVTTFRQEIAEKVAERPFVPLWCMPDKEVGGELAVYVREGGKPRRVDSTVEVERLADKRTALAYGQRIVWVLAFAETFIKQGGRVALCLVRKEGDARAKGAGKVLVAFVRPGETTGRRLVHIEPDDMPSGFNTLVNEVDENDPTLAWVKASFAEEMAWLLGGGS